MGNKLVFEPDLSSGIPEITPQQLAENLGRIMIVDVRRPEEYTGELGHIEGSKLVTLGPELVTFLEECDRTKEIVFVCRSGGRSAQATAYSLQMGFQFPRNMLGGMLAWNELSLPVTR
jgi:hydroxyacylglutathione hydrolase